MLKVCKFQARIKLRIFFKSNYKKVGFNEILFHQTKKHPELDFQLIFFQKCMSTYLISIAVRPWDTQRLDESFTEAKNWMHRQTKKYFLFLHNIQLQSRSVCKNWQSFISPSWRIVRSRLKQQLNDNSEIILQGRTLNEKIFNDSLFLK